MNHKKLLSVLEYVQLVNREYVDDDNEIVAGVTVDELDQMIDECKRVTIPAEGLRNLMDMYAYRILVVYGRNITFERFEEICKEDNIDLIDDKDEFLQYAYDVACDLYDENEANGWNEETYPTRRK